jgi:methyl-accepting chemotaxis protein
MTTRSIGKFLPALKLRLGTKAVISAILLIAVNTALVVGAAHWSLTSEFGDRALRDIEVNLRTLGLAFAETYSDAKITMKDGAVARAEIPKMPEFKDHAIVDRAVGYTGGNATLFVYDEASNQFVRRTTNVKKENGDRAVGTQLAPDHPGQAVVRRGEAYRGPATLFGKTFMTAYYPIMNSAGKVIGILYVGIPMAQYETMLSHAIQNMAIAAGIAALLVMMLTMLIVRRVTKPLRSVTASLTAIANGNADVGIDCEERMDEIGEIARTLAVFKNNSAERRRMRDEQTAAAAAAGEQRKTELRGFVDEFQTSVGGRACPHRGDRLRRTFQLDCGNHPQGPGIERDRGRCRQAGGRHRPAHQRIVGSGRADRRRGEIDHLDCRADQFAGAQCHHRGGAGRRRRPRLCRGGARGQEPRGPDRKGDGRDFQPDRQHAACD